MKRVLAVCGITTALMAASAGNASGGTVWLGGQALGVDVTGLQGDVSGLCAALPLACP